jgi:hypothetical protein
MSKTKNDLFNLDAKGWVTLVFSMGARCWKPGGPLLLVLPNVTALLLLAGTFLMLNWPAISIRSTAVKFSRGGVRMEQRGERGELHILAYHLILTTMNNK